MGETVWNETLIERLRRLWTSGSTATVIARLLGTSRNAVTSKARRLDLERRDEKAPMSAWEQMDKFAEALENGATVAEAGRAIGVRETRAKEIFRDIRRGLGEQAI